jgi:type VI secretion system (T6SS) immunity protein Tdi1
MQSHLLIDELLPIADPLAEWRWKLGPEAQVVALSRSGDAFVVQPDGAISWLDTGAGEVSPVAPSREAFSRLLENPSDAARLLLAPIVEESVRLHGPFPPGTCLGFTQLPVLGGAYTIDNRYRVSAVEHFRVTGDLHRQLRDLPDGVKVRLRVID